VNVKTDTSLTGNGTTATPLAVNVKTGTSLTGNGTTATPLAVNVKTDTSLTGNGTTASPLAVNVKTDTSLTGNGTAATPLAVNVNVKTDTSLTGNGTTATPLAVNFASGEATYDGRYLLQTGSDTLSGSLNVLGPVSVLTGLTGADAISCQGGVSVGTNSPGRALVAVGGSQISPTFTNVGGNAIEATGGSSSVSGGSPGLAAKLQGQVTLDGNTQSTGVTAFAALTVMDTSGTGNIALQAQGGDNASPGGRGGTGVNIYGGAGGTGGRGGSGISVVGGSPGAEAVNCLGGSGVGTNDSGGDGIDSLGGKGNGTGAGGNGIYASGGGSNGTGPAGLAGYFVGDVQVTGKLTKGGGTFKIDHPLDPENKFLYHSFVESPDMMNVYNGEVVLDAKGEATVELPSYFEALNRDFRYQLTCVGGFAPVYIAEKIRANRFKIAGGREGLEVSWQVTGIRQDAWANAHRVEAEVEKSPTEKGKLLHPVEHGRPESDGISWEKLQRTRALASPKATATPAAATHPELASRARATTGSARN
jgi:hypothetical protein